MWFNEWMLYVLLAVIAFFVGHARGEYSVYLKNKKQKEFDEKLKEQSDLDNYIFDSEMCHQKLNILLKILADNKIVGYTEGAIYDINIGKKSAFEELMKMVKAGKFDSAVNDIVVKNGKIERAKK